MSVSFEVELVTEMSAAEVVALVPDGVLRDPSAWGWTMFRRAHFSSRDIDQSSGGDEFAGERAFDVDGDRVRYRPTVELFGGFSGDGEEKNADQLDLLRVVCHLRWRVGGTGLFSVGVPLVAWQEDRCWFDRSGWAEADIAPVLELARPAGAPDVTLEAPLRYSDPAGD